jgi:hypothetical protein
VVKMQLNRLMACEEKTEWEDAAPPTQPPMTEAMREYAARRCHVCHCRYPPFGFGSPMKLADMTRACSTHRAQVEEQLRPSSPRITDRQDKLL